MVLWGSTTTCVSICPFVPLKSKYFCNSQHCLSLSSEMTSLAPYLWSTKSSESKVVAMSCMFGKARARASENDKFPSPTTRTLPRQNIIHSESQPSAASFLQASRSRASCAAGSSRTLPRKSGAPLPIRNNCVCKRAELSFSPIWARNSPEMFPSP